MAAIVGCAHVGGDYSVNNGGTNFLDNGVEGIKTLNVNAIKLFFGDLYDTWYPSALAGAPTSLKEMAQDASVAAVLADVSITHYFINCFTWNDGGNDLWKFGYADQPTYLSDEYAELKDLADHLIATYAGTGKTFTLQTWEGDWAYLASTTPSDFIPSRRSAFMQAYLRTRQQAVSDARNAGGQPDVTVINALELNRVADVFFDRSLTRVLNKVLPFVQMDAVSYSAYDTVFNLQGVGGEWYSSQAEWIAQVQVRLPRALDLIKAAAPNSLVYIGEWGFPENEIPVGYTPATIMNAAMDVMDAQDLFAHLYWQIWDNETPRGFGLQEISGSLSAVGTAFQARLA